MMKSRALVPMSALLVTLLSACASNPGGQGLAPAASASPQEVTRQLTRRAAMRVTVDEPERSSGEVDSLVADAGGFIEALHLESRNRAAMELKVPATNLERVLTGIRELGEVDHESVVVADVTDQIGDLDARLQNLVAVRERLRGYLERAESIEDIVSVERELTRVQIEIDRITGQLERLRDDVAMSHIRLELNRRRTLGPLGAIGYGLGWAFKKLVFIN